MFTVHTLLLQALCLTFPVIQICSGFSFSLNNHTRIRRQNQGCPEELPFALPNFPCNSGECIDGNLECNGIKECQDGSDETENCKKITCPSFMFTCNYGACIKQELKCNAHSDCSDGSDESNCTKETEIVNLCNEREFRCSNGQCIDSRLKCDGRADCTDHTDEIKATCFDVECPGFKYNCNYGACTVANAECNGVVDCFDGSDEDPAICKRSSHPAPQPPPLSVTKGRCILPPYPSFGQWFVHGSSNSFSPGSEVDSGTILKVECNENHILDGRNALFCTEGKWSSGVGRCLKICPSRLSSPTLNVTCIYKNRETQNCTEAIDGTLAKFQCAPYYEDFGLNNQAVHICHEGEWDRSKPKCEPICGQKTVEPTKLMIEGTNVTKGEYPWQVALYRAADKILICGGSLLSQRVILTAAHCITDNDGELYSKERYVVAVGKYYNKFNDDRDTEAQFSTLHAMFIPEQYQADRQNYLGDIAILVTTKVFTLSRRVQPVCLDRGHNYNVAKNQIGHVTGWGFTVENSAPSDVLKELKVPAVDISQCKTELPDDYDVFLTYDKMCAGYLDKGTSVCQGDSGGGLVFKHDNRYWITGIVSIAPTAPTGGCDSQLYGLYTKVANYVDNFILKKLAQYKT